MPCVKAWVYICGEVLSFLNAHNEVNTPGFRLDKAPFPQPIRPQGNLQWVPRSNRDRGDTQSRALWGQRLKLTTTKGTRVTILPCRWFPNVRAEINAISPENWDVPFKMISPVINQAVCVLRIVNLPPSTSHTGLWECPSKKVASRGVSIPSLEPRNKWQTD